MVLQTNSEIINNQENHNSEYPISGNNFLFLDDQTKNNKIIFMIFNTYVLHTLLDYFQDFHVNNIIFIKENYTLSNEIIQEIRNYEHLVEYGEFDKI